MDTKFNVYGHTDDSDPVVAPGLLIGGELCEPAERRPSINPSTGRAWATIPWAGEAEVEAAVGAARAALEQTDWRTNGTKRAAVLRQIASVIRDNAEELAKVETADNGKPLWGTRLEIDRVPKYFEYFAGYADKIIGDYFTVEPDYAVTLRREPYGVVAAIAAWNSPLLLFAMKLGPALACGNTTVLKPAESASVSSLRLGQLLLEAGIPAGIINIVVGDGKVGETLIADEGVDLVSFTGGTATAERILAQAAKNITPAKIEAGGKAAHIVFEDADIETAMRAAVAGAFISGGQSCTSGARVLVQSSIYDEFVDAFLGRSEKLKVGAPEESGTHIGPMAHEAHRDHVQSFLDQSPAEGARPHPLALPPDEDRFKDGYFVRPTVMLDVTPEMTIAQEEVFGPVPAVMRFDDESEAVAIANSTRYGLVGGLWTESISRAERVANAIDAGTVWINCYRALHWAVPFGGNRSSGIGRENGPEIVHEFTRVKSVMTAVTPNPLDPFDLES